MMAVESLAVANAQRVKRTGGRPARAVAHITREVIRRALAAVSAIRVDAKLPFTTDGRGALINVRLAVLSKEP
jgi:hypothetical protein